MELDRIGTLALRALATDLANLTARLAVMTAVMEDLIQQTNGLSPATWDSEPVYAEGAGGDATPIDLVTRISGEEMDRIRSILQHILDMQ